jgi:hypothetical protein
MFNTRIHYETQMILLIQKLYCHNKFKELCYHNKFQKLYCHNKFKELCYHNKFQELYYHNKFQE